MNHRQRRAAAARARRGSFVSLCEKVWTGNLPHSAVKTATSPSSAPPVFGELGRDLGKTDPVIPSPPSILDSFTHLSFGRLWSDWYFFQRR